MSSVDQPLEKENEARYNNLNVGNKMKKHILIFIYSFIHSFIFLLFPKVTINSRKTTQIIFLVWIWNKLPCDI